MASPAKKQDSNIVVTSIAAETAVPGVLPADNVTTWFELEPNSFDDFGGENTLLSRKFISSGRQRTKGSIVDKDAGGGVNIDLTQSNHQFVMPGLMFAAFRDKGRSPIANIAANAITVLSAAGFGVGSIVLPLGVTNDANRKPFVVSAVAGNVLTIAGGAVEAGGPLKVLSEVGVVGAAGDIDVDTTGTFPALISTVLDFTTLGLVAGEFIFVGGDLAVNAFVQPENNGFKRIRSITAHRMELDKSEIPMDLEDGAGLSIHIYWGRFIKNEKGSLIRRQSYQIERTLGAPDQDDLTKVQAEYLLGSFFDEAVFNMETADKVNVDLTVLSLNSGFRKAETGPKAGARVEAPGEDPFNTSTDVPVWHLAVIEPGNESPKPLFAYMTAVNFTLANNMVVNKGIGVLGGFDVTAGTFEVDIETTAYFSDIDACIAVNQNSDVTLHGALVARNAGILVDFPLLGLGGGQLNVEVDNPVMIPLTSEAATGKKIAAHLDHTISFSFFDYLPTMANPA